MGKKTLGSVLREARLRNGLSQREVAAAVDIKASYVAYLETDRRRPTIALLLKIARYLGLDGQEALFLSYPECKPLIKLRPRALRRGRAAS